MNSFEGVEHDLGVTEVLPDAYAAAEQIFSECQEIIENKPRISRYVALTTVAGSSNADTHWRAKRELQDGYVEFADYLLAGAKDAAQFNERIDFLTNGEIIDNLRYRSTVNPSGISLTALSQAIFRGYSDLNDSLPEEGEKALKHLVNLFKKAPDEIEEDPEGTKPYLYQALSDEEWSLRVLAGKFNQVCAEQVGSNHSTFQLQLLGGYFEDQRLTTDQISAVTFLGAVSYGDPAPRTPDALLTKFSHTKVSHDSLHVFRYFNRRVSELSASDQLVRYSQKSPDLYFKTSFTTLVNLLEFMSNDLGAGNAGKLAAALRERANGRSIPSYQEVVRFANQLTSLVNRDYFNEEPKNQLSMLDDKSIDSLPYAFDRILFVAWKDSAIDWAEMAPQDHELCEEAAECLMNILEIGIVKNHNIKVITIGDIIAKFPNATTEEINRIAEQVTQGSGLQKAAQWYRDQKRKSGGRAFFTKWRTGYGIFS